MHAFFYNGSTMFDLNDITNVPSGWTLEVATGINDKGQICGWGQDSLAHDIGFVLTPVPEPSSVILLAIGGFGVAALVLSKRRRRLTGR